MKAQATKPMVPITACLLAEAVHDDGAMAKLAGRAVYLRAWGVQYWPCLHEPRCTPVTPAQMAGLVEALPALAPLAEFLAQKESGVLA